MLALKIDLLQGRYHANPQNRAHTEGMVEWPPSPYRLCRALFAGGFKAGLAEVDMKAAIAPLTQVLPSYYLPPASYSQTRSPRKDRSDDTQLFSMGKDVVDAWLNFDQRDRVIWVQWETELPLEQQLILTQCLAYCRYLGRRESDAAWSIVGFEDMPTPNAYPDPKGAISVAVCNDDINGLLNQNWRIEKRQTPPGLAWASYHHEQQSIQLAAPRPDYHQAELSFSTQGRPQLKASLYWIEKLHQTLAQLGTPSFTGCDVAGNPLGTNQHVYISPIADTQGVLIGFSLQCSAGFTADEIDHLYKLERLYGKRQEGTVRVVGFKAASELVQAESWESLTPFYMSRYPKNRNGKPRLIAGTHYQKDGPEQQALRALCYLPQFNLDPKTCTYQATDDGLTMVCDGDAIATVQAEKWPQSWQWKSDRKHGKKVGDTGYRLRLSFPVPIAGPIALGYSAHYGLGVLRGLVGVETTQAA